MLEHAGHTERHTATALKNKLSVALLTGGDAKSGRLG
jgi:hypothetical protein